MLWVYIICTRWRNVSFNNFGIISTFGVFLDETNNYTFLFLYKRPKIKTKSRGNVSVKIAFVIFQRVSESDNHPLMVAANKVLTDKKEAMCWLFGKSKGGLSHSINHCHDQFEKTTPFDYNALLKSSRKCYKKWELLSRNPAEK